MAPFCCQLVLEDVTWLYCLSHDKLLKVLDELAGDILVNNKKFHMNAKNVLDYHSTFRL